jgi:hypothetical protein
VIFFWDPLQPHPHDVDVEALPRIAVVSDIPIACSRSSADFMVSSPLMSQRYERAPRRLRAPHPPGGRHRPRPGSLRRSRRRPRRGARRPLRRLPGRRVLAVRDRSRDAYTGPAVSERSCKSGWSRPGASAGPSGGTRLRRMSRPAAARQRQSGCPLRRVESAPGRVPGWEEGG